MIARLKDAATRWLKPTTDDGSRIVELIVIEQLLSVLPHRIQSVCQMCRSCGKILQRLMAESLQLDLKEPEAGGALSPRGPVERIPTSKVGHG